MCHPRPILGTRSSTRGLHDLWKWVFRDGPHRHTDTQTDTRTCRLTYRANPGAALQIPLSFNNQSIRSFILFLTCCFTNYGSGVSGKMGETLQAKFQPHLHFGLVHFSVGQSVKYSKVHCSTLQCNVSYFKNIYLEMCGKTIPGLIMHKLIQILETISSY